MADRGREFVLEGVPNVEALVLIAHEVKEAGLETDELTFSVWPRDEAEEDQAIAIARKYGASWGT
jgi:hypothetical protein